MTEVVVERHGGVVVCRLNRPQQRNGLTGTLLGEYLAALGEAREGIAAFRERRPPRFTGR
jgi:enoyl-CoA hydratase/carnithine racemase